MVADNERTAFLASDSTLYFVSNIFGTADIWRAAPNGSGGFADPIELTALNSVLGEASPILSADAKIILFASDRAGAGHLDIYVACRNSTTTGFANPQPQRRGSRGGHGCRAAALRPKAREENREPSCEL